MGDLELPELVLEIIFENLKDDQETLVSCAKVSSAWDELLWRKKPHFILHLVLPLVASHLSYRDMMQCRLVSQYWKRAVDGINQQVPEWVSRIEPTYYFNEMDMTGLRRLPFSGRTNIDSSRGKCHRNFLGHMNLRSENPFPTRVLTISHEYAISRKPGESDMYSPTEIYTRFGDYVFAKTLQEENQCQKMLQVFGSHIWHLVYSLCSGWYTCPAAADEFSRWVRARLGFSPMYLVNLLRLVPNLRSLALVIHINKRSSKTRQNKIWNSSIAPIPILPNLVSLNIKLSKNDPAITHFLFTSYSQQLENLECQDQDLLQLQTDNNTPFAFPKLLNLKLLSKDIFPGANLDLECNSYLQKLDSNVMAPCLQKLSLKLHDLGSDCMNLHNMIAGSRAFSKSLVELYVGIMPNYAFMDQNNYGNKDTYTSMDKFDCVFRRLTTFHISFRSSSLSPSSAHLSLVLCSMPGLTEFRILGRATIRDLDEIDHLWRILPSLERLYVGKRRETRHEAELRGVWREKERLELLEQDRTNGELVRRLRRQAKLELERHDTDRVLLEAARALELHSRARALACTCSSTNQPCPATN